METTFANRQEPLIQDPMFARAYDIWMEYYQTTERFDQNVCQHFDERTGHAMPMTAEEQRMCSRNAWAEQERAWRQLRAMPITVDVVRAAQRAAARDFESGQIRPLRPTYLAGR